MNPATPCEPVAARPRAVADAAPPRTYSMSERSDDADFEIRGPNGRHPLVGPHRHEHFQIIAMLDGHAQHAVGGSVKRVGPGSLTFVLPYRVHVATMPDGADYRVINFSPRLINAAQDRDPLEVEHWSTHEMPALAPFLAQERMDFALSGAPLDELRTMLATLAADSAAADPGSRLMLQATLWRLLGMVCRMHEPELSHVLAQHAPGTVTSRWMQRLTRHLQEHLDEDLTLGDAAAAVAMSPSHLARALKRDTGRTFVELLTERRMRKACELLINTPRRLGDIARTCGFADESYFARRFRMRFGMSPGDYRRQGDAGRCCGTAAEAGLR